MSYTFGENTAKRLLEISKQPPNRPTSEEKYRNDSAPIIFRNDSGETIPPYAVMRVTGAEDNTSSGRKLVIVNKPNGSPATFLFNGRREVEAGNRGTAQKGPVVKAKYSSGTPAANESWGPNSTWDVASDGDTALVVYGSIDTDLLMGNTSVAVSAAHVVFTLPSELTDTQTEKLNCTVVRFWGGADPGTTVKILNEESGVDNTKQIHKGPSGAKGIGVMDGDDCRIIGIECDE